MSNSSNENSSAEVYALLDSGSQRSFVTNKLAKQLNIRLQDNDNLFLHTFASPDSTRYVLPKAELNLYLTDGVLRKLRLNVIENMTTKLNTCVVDNTGFTSSGHAVKPDILIGVDYYWELISLELTKTRDGFYVLPTRVGEIVTGKQSVGVDKDGVTNSVISCYAITDPTLQFWDLETLGIKESPDVNADDIALKQFYKSLEFKSQRYVVSWPYKNVDCVVSDNYFLCYSRLKLMLNCLNKENLLGKYNEIIKDQLSKEIIEEFKDNKPNCRVSYLPHYPVITLNKQTTKVRIVYDASAKLNKNMLSLNETLYRGPVMLPELCGILLRFRTFKYGVIADIEKTFLQIELHEKDKDMTRFLWVTDPNKGLSSNNLKIYRFRRIAFGVVSSPFLLTTVIRYHLNMEVQEVCREGKIQEAETLQQL